MGLDRALESAQKTLNPANLFKDPRAFYDPARFTEKVKVPELETPPPAPTRDDAANSAAELRKKRRGGRESTIFTSQWGDTSDASVGRPLLRR